MQLNSINKLNNPTQIWICNSENLPQNSLTDAELAFINQQLEEGEAEINRPDLHVIVLDPTDKSYSDLRKKGHGVFQKVKNYANVDLFLTKEHVSFLEGYYLSSYQFLKYFSDPKKNKIELTQIIGIEDDELQLLVNELDAVLWARDLVNEPHSFLSAQQLALEIKKQGEKSGFHTEIFEKQKIEALKMGGLLAVNKGSINPPTFTIMEWKPEKSINSKPLVLVGKGIVYDTGGLSLKPTPHSMDLMKSDMGGAACMAGAISAIAKNKLPVHVIALIPATDNRPGLNAYAPGDVIKMFDGTTVEVLNTDAEGRMVMADALSYAKKYHPDLVIDAATLTGAAVRAIGTKASINMGNANDKVFETMKSSGEDCGDRVVQFPFWDEYKEDLKSDIADMKNLGGPYAGMITAGKFLEHFTDYPYVHIDIAGPAFLESPDTYHGKGGTGAGVRLIYNFVKNYFL